MRYKWRSSRSAEGIRPGLPISVVRIDVTSFYQHLKSISMLLGHQKHCKGEAQVPTWSTWSNMNTITHPLR